MQHTVLDRASVARSLHRKARPTAATHCVGIVTDVSPGVFVIGSGGVVLRGKRAASCLLEPCMGDTVTCVLVAPDEVWILGILQREEGTVNTLRFDGPTELKVESGALSFDASDIHLRGDGVSMDTRKLQVSVDEAEVIGRQFHLFGGALKMVGAAIDTVFDRVSHFSKQYLRTTEGTDRVQAQIVEQQAKQLLHQSGEHVLINGNRLIKARGGQIHFG